MYVAFIFFKRLISVKP